MKSIIKIHQINNQKDVVNIQKVIAKIEGIITKGNLRTLEKGVVIDGRKTSRAKVKLKSTDKKIINH